MIPKGGVGRYSYDDGVLEDRESDAAFFNRLKEGLPDSIEVVEREENAEDPAFVRDCVDRLIALIESQP